MNKKRSSKKLMTSIFNMMLIVAMVLSTAGCSGSKNNYNEGAVSTENPIATESVMETETESGILEESITSENVTILGEGETVFPFTVVDAEENETLFEIHTDKEMVGEALLDLGLIEGEDGAYGLYVKTVNGITLDYDKDNAYWAFYVNGEYAMSGVDTTPITEGETYMFKVEKA